MLLHSATQFHPFSTLPRGELHRNQDLDHTIKPCHWSRPYYVVEDCDALISRLAGPPRRALFPCSASGRQGGQDPAHSGARPFPAPTSRKFSLIRHMCVAGVRYAAEALGLAATFTDSHR